MQRLKTALHNTMTDQKEKIFKINSNVVNSNNDVDSIADIFIEVIPD